MTLQRAPAPIDQLEQPRLRRLSPGSPGRRVILGPWQFTALALALAAFAVTFWTRIAYDDYWWLLAIGRYLTTLHKLPVPDPFSFSEAGRVWPAHEWLSALIMYALHQRFGIWGPMTLFALCSAQTALLMMSTLRRIGVRLLPASMCTFLMILAVGSGSGPYPQVFAFALLTAEIWCLERWLARRGRTIWLLPLILLLWGNLHGSFLVGIAVPVLLLAGELVGEWLDWTTARLTTRDRRQLLIALGLCLVALLIDPNGPSLILYPITHFHNPLNALIAGNAPTSLTEPRNWPFFLLTGGYIGLVVLRRARVPLADLLIAAALTAGALFTWRFEPFAAICLVPCIGRVLSLPGESGLRVPRVIVRLQTWRETRALRTAQPSTARQLVSAGVLALIAIAIVALAPPYNPTVVTPEPVAAVAALRSNPIPGPVFNEFNWGGYLIWELWPQSRVFVDGRGTDLYTDGGVLRAYFDVITLQSDVDQVLDHYGIRSLLFERDAPLTRYLLAGGHWRSTYDDGQAVVLQRQP